MTAYVGLGANLGDARAALRSALSALAVLERTELQASSPFYRTEPVNAGGPDFTNAVAQLATRLDAHALLGELQRIENEHGRERPYVNAPRSLDLDLLLYGDALIASPTLQVPHPRLHERAFVLKPLADIAPGLVIPGRGPLIAMLSGIKDQRIERIEA